MMAGKTPGDLVRATLVVEDSRGYLIDDRGHRTCAADRAAAGPCGDRSCAGRAGPGRPAGRSERRRRGSCRTGAARSSPSRSYTPAVRCRTSARCMDRQFAAVQREAASDAQLRDRLHLVSVTLDPAFDTPAVLLEHARRVGARPERLELRHRRARRARSLRIAVRRVGDARRSGGQPTIIHNLRTAVIDPEGRLTTIFSGNEWTRAGSPEGAAACRRRPTDAPAAHRRSPPRNGA